MSASWHRIGISIRTVIEKRPEEARALLERVSFAPHAMLSPHRSGRTVPESYADAIAAFSESNVDWVLQLEDDAILAPDFELQAERLLQRVHGDDRIGLVSFYSGRRIKGQEGVCQPPADVELEVLSGGAFLMAQAFALRSSLVADHNAFMLHFTAERPYATDTATAAWMKARRLRYARAWPSLVQHRDLPSLSGHRRNPNRFSQSFDARYGVTR